MTLQLFVGVGLKKNWAVITTLIVVVPVLQFFGLSKCFKAVITRTFVTALADNMFFCAYSKLSISSSHKQFQTIHQAYWCFTSVCSII